VTTMYISLTDFTPSTLNQQNTKKAEWSG